MRHPDLWFEDGSIVIQAENTMFKVFKSILCRESHLFRDMFSLPQPATAAEIYDGCPLLRVPETADEFSILLRAVFEHAFLHNVCEGFEYATILRLSTKYELLGLRKGAVDILLHEYPAFDLDGIIHIWARCSCHASMATNCLTIYPEDMDPGDRWKIDVAIINAARKADALLLLPSAMLCLCCTNMETIVSGGLDDINRDAILIALPKLWSLAKEHTYKAIMANTREITKACPDPNFCFSIRDRVRAIQEDSPCLINPVGIIDFDLEPASLLCEHCLKYAEETYETGIKVAWEKIPEAFDLPGWEELRKKEAEFMEGGPVSEQNKPSENAAA